MEEKSKASSQSWISRKARHWLVSILIGGIVVVGWEYAERALDWPFLAIDGLSVGVAVVACLMVRHVADKGYAGIGWAEFTQSLAVGVLLVAMAQLTQLMQQLT